MLAGNITVPVHWIFLQGDYSLIRERLQQRKGHYMPPGLLQSQFDTLETPKDAMVMDITNEPGKIVEMIMQGLK